MFEGKDYYGNPNVRVLSVSDNVKIKPIAGLNALYQAVMHAVSLNTETAPDKSDCIKETVDAE